MCSIWLCKPKLVTDYMTGFCWLLALFPIEHQTCYTALNHLCKRGWAHSTICELFHVFSCHNKFATILVLKLCGNIHVYTYYTKLYKMYM